MTLNFGYRNFYFLDKENEKSRVEDRGKSDKCGDVDGTKKRQVHSIVRVETVSRKHERE